MKITIVAVGVLLLWTSGSLAQGQATSPSTPPAFKFEAHGFASGTIFAQDGNLSLGGGQGALFVNPQTATTKAPTTDRLVLSGDVRQTRFNFSVAGPGVFGGATPKAVLEIDFFGNFGSGPYGDVSLTPRMRLAYGELNWGATRIQFGQNNDLIIPQIPVSLAHIAFPVAYGSGSVGWRRPAIWGFHTLGDAKNKDATRLELAWEVGRSQWNDTGNVGNGIGSSIVGATGDAYGFNLGAASGFPALEARVTLLGGQVYSAYVVAHYQKIDRTGVGAGSTTTSGVSSDLDVIVGEFGGKAVVGPITLLGNVYAGKNTAPLVGSFIQFQPNSAGDVSEWGGWIQAGYNFTKELSLFGYLGSEQTSRADARAASYKVLGQVTSGALLQYRDGGYAVGLEFFHFHTSTVAPAASFDSLLMGNQLLASGNYFF